MYKKNLIREVLFFLMLSISANASVTITDDFNTPHNYLTDGLIGVVWDGIIGLDTGETVTSMNANITNYPMDSNIAGLLYISSANGMWWPGFIPLGAMLYEEVAGNFIAQVKLPYTPGLVPSDPWPGFNNFGIMARAATKPADLAGTGEDFISLDCFPVAGWSCGLKLQNVDDGDRTMDNGDGGTGYNYPRWVQIERSGNTFYLRKGDDGITWTAYSPTASITRSDIGTTNLPAIMIGLHHSTGTEALGYGTYDNFKAVADSDPINPYARWPIPRNNSVDVNIPVTLRWVPGDTVKPSNGHELYISKVKSDVDGRNAAAKVVLSTASYSPALQAGRYYWCVDEIDAASVKWPGPTWTLTTIGMALDPIPFNDQKNIDVNLPELIWTPSPIAQSQDFYFGTLYSQVYNSTTPTISGLAGDANSTPTPGIPLDKGKTFYWRVDTHTASLGVGKGDVWAFSTAYPIEICDNFDVPHDYASGTAGTIWDGILGKDDYVMTMATDVNSGKLYIQGGNCWWEGYDTGILLYKEVVGNFAASVEVTDYQGLWESDHASAVYHTVCFLMARVGNIDNAGPGEDWTSIAYFPLWGVGNAVYNNDIWRQELAIEGTGWNSDKYLKLERSGDNFYYSHSPNGSTWTYSVVSPITRSDMNGLPVQLGLGLATYSSSMTAIEFDNFCFSRDLIAKAYGPQPNDGGGLDLMRPVLSWSPGDFAGSHNVYFGNSFNDVNNATPASPEYRGPANVQGPDASGRFSYNAGQYETIVISNSYYWRVDEVNATNPASPWKGNTWKFTVQDYSTIDSFEKYISTGFPSAPGTLRRTWIDGYWSLTKIVPTPPAGQPQYKITSSASFVQLNTDSADGGANPGALRYFNDANIALLGKQSMKLYYENDGFYQWLIWLYGSDAVTFKFTAPKFSEVMAAIDDAARLVPATQDSLGLKRNWSGYKLLRIPFYGDPNNTLVPTDKLYVGLWDGDNNPTTPVVIEHSDNTKLQKNWWQDWYIPLSSFPAANANFSLSNVARIYIGVGNRTTPATGGIGNIFFDEIQLLAKGVCIPGSVKTDFNNDCRTDMNDLELMTEVWLGQSPTLPAPLIRLDASALPLGTLNSWANTGSKGGSFVDFNNLNPNNNPKVAMVEGVKAVVFDGNDLLIADFNTPAEMAGTKPFTIIYTVLNHEITDDEEVFAWAKRGTTARYAAACYGSSAAYGAIAHWGAADMGFDRGVPAPHIWHKIAITYQGEPNSTEIVMVDGVGSSQEGPKTLDIWPNCVMTVGSSYNGDPYLVKVTPALFFSGALAKLEFYDVALKPGDLAILMGTPINLFSSDSVINFKDLAVLANKWLVGPVLFQ